MNDRVPWSGVITAVQPRIRLTRSFDERSHTYLGYLLRIQGTIGTTLGEFRIAVGPGAHAQHEFHLGDSLAVWAIGLPIPGWKSQTFIG